MSGLMGTLRAPVNTRRFDHLSEMIIHESHL